MPLPQLGTATGVALAAENTARLGIEGHSVLAVGNAVKFRCGKRLADSRRDDYASGLRCRALERT
jgi:hypothetical protein